jgi:hypothetical protein
VIHQSGCRSPAPGSFENGYWLYKYEYWDVIGRTVDSEPALTARSAVSPPPVAASGML